jgi:hypothetical protein
VSETTPAKRLAALAADFKTSDAWDGSVITDGLNAASTWASEGERIATADKIPGASWPAAVFNAQFKGTPSLLESYARITGSITMRLDTFRPNPNDDVQKQRDALLAVAVRTGCRIDLACNFIGNWNPSHRKEGGIDYHLNPAGDEYTNDKQQGTYGAMAGMHDMLLGWWAGCLSRAKAAGVRPRYVLCDHPPNMEAWKAGQSDKMDALIMQRWRAMFELVRDMMTQYVKTDVCETFCNETGEWVPYYEKSEPHLIVYGQLFGDVLPEPRETGWLSHNGYNTGNQDTEKEHSAFRMLVRNQRNERLLWWFEPDGREDVRDWGRRFAGRWVEEHDYGERISALCFWPCVFSTPESVDGVVAFLEGLRG